MKRTRHVGSFVKDYKRVKRRGYALERLEIIIDLLRRGESLPLSARPHALHGTWIGYHECHVRGDWLLVYKVTDEEVCLARTGTHADVFD